jgi:hypothetical protein
MTTTNGYEIHRYRFRIAGESETCSYCDRSYKHECHQEHGDEIRGEDRA